MANIIFKLFTTIIFLPIFAIKTPVLLSKIQSYLKFLSKSNNQHGIHSPFVYNFIIKCLYNNKLILDHDINQFDRFKHTLLQNENTIEVTDFGAGSKVFKNNTRKISAIAKNAGISKKRGLLLFKISKYFKPNNILEIGTSLGAATASLAIVSPKAKITTLEGCPETAKIAENQFNEFNFKNINIQVGDFKNTLPKSLEGQNFDLIYFDGNHQKQATINYFEQCLASIHNETIFIFDDIHWSKEMEEAWNYIKNHKKVSVSIDTYQWGIIFFRKEQPKEHFTIRI